MKQIHIHFSDEVFAKLKEVSKKANTDFLDGKVSYSEILSWSLTNCAFDFAKLRQRCLDPKRIAKNINISSKIDIEATIKKLSILKNQIEESETLKKEVE